MYLIIVCLLTFGYGSCQPCINCSCPNWLKALICDGPGVGHFPEVDGQKEWISHIDLWNTSISTLPSFNQSSWPKLFSLDIRENSLLDCRSVTHLRSRRLDLLITSDCHKLNDFPVTGGGLKPEPKQDLEWVFSLAVLPIMFASVIALYIGSKLDVRFSRSFIKRWVPVKRAHFTLNSPPNSTMLEL